MLHLLAGLLLGNSAVFEGTGQLGLGFKVTGQNSEFPSGVLNPTAPGNKFSHNRMSQTSHWTPMTVPLVALSSGVTRVSAGFYHTVFVKADGTAWAAGYNSFGQLGQGDVVARHEPTQLAAVGALGAGAVPSAGYYHTMVTGGGAVWSVGTDESGQLGRVGAATDTTTPLAVSLGATAGTIAVAETFKGGREVQTLTCTATAGTFKLTHGGQTTPALAFGATANQVQTALVALSTIASATVTFSTGAAACSGAGVGMVVTFTGSIIDEAPMTKDVSLLSGGTITVAETFKGGREVQTLTCTATAGTFKLTHGGQTTPALAFGATANQVQTALVALSTIASATVTFSTGAAACSGAGVGMRVTFTGSVADEAPVTTDVLSLGAGADPVFLAAAGGRHSLVVTKNAGTGVTNLYAFGAGGAGQLGLRAFDDVGTPTLVRTFSTVASPNYPRRYPVTAAGDRLGHSPALVPSAITKVAAGYYHSVVLLADKTIFTCGDGTAGQLGHGEFSNRDVFTRVWDMKDVADIAAGYAHTVVVKTDGTVLAVGAGSYGQLGLGDFKPHQWFTKLTGITSAKRVWAGQYHTALLMADATLRTCGFNDYGQLGHGDDIDRGVPTAVAGLAGVVDAGLGYRHTAVVAGGKALTFGNGAETYEYVQE